MKASRTHTLLLLFAVIVTLIVGAVYGYMSHAVGNSVEKSAAAHASVVAAQSNSSRDQAYMQQYQLTAVDWARLPEFFVPSDNILSFIEAVESIGQVTGATTTLSNIDADNLDNAATGTLGSIRVHVDTDGSWTAAMRTLMLAEVLPYKTAVNNIRLDSTVTGPENEARRSWRLSFDLRATTIARHLPAATPAPAATAAPSSQ